jgi:FKBP-type peptidyl-prolyl cis-trans isomerase FkpA
MKPLSITAAALLAAFAMQAGAAEPKAVKTASGIAITTIKDGTGASPKASDTVKVHYRGTLVDGKEFDSSYGRGQPASFPLNRVIPCWTEGVQTMKVGGKAKAALPAQSGLRQPRRAGHHSARFEPGVRDRAAGNRQVATRRLYPRYPRKRPASKSGPQGTHNEPHQVS